MKDWIVKKLLLGWLKDKLDKLPMDGLKTVLGVLVIVLGEVLKTLDPSQASYSIVKVVLEYVNMLGPDVITDMGIVALITGAIHKLLKYFDKPAAE